MARVNFPKIGSKHSFNSLFDPSKLFEGARKLHIQKKVVLIYNKKLEKQMVKTLKLRKHKVLAKLYNCDQAYGSKLLKNTIILKINIGAPLTATIAEEIIQIGARELLILGTAGSLNAKIGFGDLVICNKTVRDDGTSHHYLKNSTFAYPDTGLTRKLSSKMRSIGINFISGPSWTIDAPYRETPEEVRHYKKKGILTVEMEASALFAVAVTRKVKAAAIFTISDILDFDSWSGFTKSSKAIRSKRAYPQMCKIVELFDA
ncbi:MAG TPA: nucleoside phosphorylase [Candidatus Acidoferrum sp.]|nr:nucleoside phosphorylase [Candidatus Acidoferrum sp.]